MNASELFAGIAQRSGTNRCYYCGASCDETHRVADYVKDTFTNRDIVRFPGSEYVCVGCALSLGAGPDEMVMIDGSTKLRENDRGMQPRMYSWVLTGAWKRAATKAHLSHLREACLVPPSPPFAIVLADSGQKQLIFRAPVALSRATYPLLLEDEMVVVDPAVLRTRIETAKRAAAAVGKPALLEPQSVGQAIACEKYWGELSPLVEWWEIQQQPISRLAAWLCPGRKECQVEYPGSYAGAVPAETGGVRGPGAGDPAGEHRAH